MAVAVAPLVGFWVYKHGWVWLCIVTASLNAVMAGIAFTLEEHRPPATATRPEGGLIEWRVLIMSITLALYSFGYGGITSFTAMYADANGVQPKSLYLSALAVVILLTRPVLGRLGDVWGYKRVFVPCLILIVIGMSLLALGGTRGWMLASAIVFGVGFGTASPSYVGYVMQHVSPYRRGAAFGALLAAFDTGIGTGSTTMGWLIQRFDFSTAFAVATALAALAIPYFLVADRYYWNSPQGIQDTARS